MIGIIGANGNIGSEIIKILGNTNERIVGITRSSKQENNFKNILWRQANILDSKSLSKALKGCRTAYFFIPLNPQTEDFFEDVQLTINSFIIAAKEVSLEYVVALSSIGASVNNDAGMFNLAKQLEQSFTNMPFKSVFIRPAEFMENWNMYNEVVEAEGILPSFHLPLNEKFEQVSVKDIASVIANLLITKNESHKIIQVLGPKQYSPKDVSHILSNKRGSPITPIEVARETWSEELDKEGLSQSYKQELMKLYDALNSGWIKPNDNIKTIFGTTTLEEVLKE